MSNYGKLISQINAIDKWEGFNYQGHLALFYSIKLIKSLLSSNNYNANILSNYKLQIEGAEDFSILIDKKYISLHQVKSGSVNLSKRDKFCFIIGIMQEGSFGYFHVNRNVSVPSNFVESTIEHIDGLLHEIKDKKVVYKSDISKSEYNKFVVIEEIKLNHTKGSLYSILKTTGNYKNKGDVETSLEGIKESLEGYKKLLIGKSDKDFYEIYDKKFNSSEEIKEKSYGIIKEINEVINQGRLFYCNDEYIKNVYKKIYDKLHKEVTKFRDLDSKVDECTLNFSKLYRLIVENNYVVDDTYENQYDQVKNVINDEFSKFIEYKQCKGSDCEGCKNINDCNLNEQINLLLQKNNDDFMDIIYKLILFNPILGKSIKLPGEQLINCMLIDQLFKINKLKLSDSNKFIAFDENNNSYRLSLNEDTILERFIQELNLELKKDDNIPMAFEEDVIITKNLEDKIIIGNDSILYLRNEYVEKVDNINNANNKNDFYNTNLKTKDVFYKPKEIRLINKDTSINELRY